jgi:DamX protein
VGGRFAADTQSREQGSLLQDEAWIREQDPNRYTIQVIALSSLPRLEQLVHGFEDAGPFAFFVVQKNSKPLYVLLQGSYPDAKSAHAAGARIPAAMQNRDELWIRRFDGVQRSLE